MWMISLFLTHLKMWTSNYIDSFLPLNDDNWRAEDNRKHINTNETYKYYASSDLNSIDLETMEKSFIHMNIASLNLHESELNLFLNKSNVKFNFIGISETGLKKGSTNNINIGGYNLNGVHQWGVFTTICWCKFVISFDTNIQTKKNQKSNDCQNLRELY